MTLSSLPLSYCTNVHPGLTVAAVAEGLRTYTAQVRRRIRQPLAAGLWLARPVVAELLNDTTQLENLAAVLEETDLCCYTLNAFPYGDFHSERVKENVYLPDWSTAERAHYTMDCARVLAALLPDGTEGSLSTLPLGGKMLPHTSGFEDDCCAHLVDTARFLSALREETGQVIRLAIEPEPMCELSSIPHEAVPFFRRLRDYAAQRGALNDVVEHLGLCFDVCHQAVEFEDVAESIDLLASEAIRINKVHITCAIELLQPAENAAGREALGRYVEPRYLHQTKARMADGSILSRLDLTAEDLFREPPDEFLQADSWRVHFHVPVNAEHLGSLQTTRKQLREALARVAGLPYAPHLEVETYTWEVLPGGESVELVEGLSQEITATYELLEGLA